jgi:hypothetical protein
MRALEQYQTQHRTGDIMRIKRTIAVLTAGTLWALIACAQQPPAYQPSSAGQQPPANQPSPAYQQQPAGQQPTAGQQSPAYQQPPAYQQAPPDHEPSLNVSPYRHGNIARAQEFSRNAYDAMTQAQQANEFDMGGHAERAKQLLAQANDEMKLAAQWANHRR